ncbi:MAG: peptidoglycan-binding protein [Candidatus Omnitrophica bacterium]|nr:peptidoglycan-binding protein [Candidatus Omnitrophota bacterium]
MTALPSDGPTRVKTIQQALQAAGYSPGAVDGRMGRQTQKAIREFQEAHGLGVDGKVGPRTWAKLGAYLQNPETSAAPSSTE